MVVTLRLVEHILKRRPSITVVPAMLGGVALELAAEHRPDLILLDLNLPDMSGEEILARFKADPATAATPVIILSGDTAPERIDHVLAAGATAYLTKPLSVQSFLRAIDAILAKPEPEPEPQPETPRGETSPGETAWPHPAPLADDPDY